MESKTTKDLTDLELATLILQETNLLGEKNQQAQGHLNNLQLLQQEVQLRNEAMPKEKSKK